MQEDVCLDTFNSSNESEFILSLVYVSDPNITDRFGNSLVHRAIMEGPEALSHVLNIPGIDVNMINQHEESPLIWAVGKGDIDAAKTLLDNKADANIQLNGGNIGHIAATSHNPAMLPFLHSYGSIEIDAEDDNGRTPLVCAAQSGRHQTIQWLLQHRADACHEDKANSIALHAAVENNNSQSVQALVEYGPSEQLFVRNRAGDQPHELSQASSYDRQLLSELVGREQSCFYSWFDWCTSDSYRIPSMRRYSLKIMFYFLANQSLAILHTLLWIFPKDLVPDVLIYVFLGLAASAIVIYFIVKSSDPGKYQPVQSGDQSDERLLATDLEYERLLRAGKTHRLCITTETILPWRSKYCKEAGFVIERFDHYCPWVGNAVGLKNYRMFIFYMLLETSALILYVILDYAFVHLEHDSSFQEGNAWDITGMVLAFILGFQTGFLILHNLALIIVHFWLISSNLTTSDYLKWWKYPYLNDGGNFVNVYDQGCFSNWMQFLCNSYDHPVSFEDWTAEEEPITPAVSGQVGPCPFFRYWLGG